MNIQRHDAWAVYRGRLAEKQYWYDLLMETEPDDALKVLSRYEDAEMRVDRAFYHLLNNGWATEDDG